MSDAPYLRLHGLEITDNTPANRVIVRDSLSPSGGGLKTDSNSATGLDYAVITENGREAFKFSFQVWSKDRTLVERVRKEANNAPIGAEFQCFNDDQVLYITKASATPAKPKSYMESGAAVVGYYSDIEVYCRNALFRGPFQGIPYGLNVALPASTSLTNAGNYPATIDYLLMSGAYDAILGYTDDVDLVIDSEAIRLCDTLLRDDIFKLSDTGDVLHSYETDFPKTYAQTQNDLFGPTYVDYGTGGSIAYQSFTIGNSGKLIMPSKGPLPVKDRPYLEITCSQVIGTPKVSYACVADLSDIEYMDVGLEVGLNEIYVPNLEGEDDVFIGVTTDAYSVVTLTNFYAEVPRYISYGDLPKVEAGDSFSLQIQDGEYSNHLLNVLYLAYKDKF